MKRFNKTNKELAEMYNGVINGTVNAEEFFKEIMPVVNYIITTNFNVKGSDADDIAQNTMVKLMTEISERKTLTDSSKSFFKMRIINIIEKLISTENIEVPLTHAYSICDDETLDNTVNISIMKDLLRRRMQEILNEREQKVINMRFGLENEKFGLAGTGRILGISRERVRQIEVKALFKLRRDSEVKELINLL